MEGTSKFKVSRAPLRTTRNTSKTEAKMEQSGKAGSLLVSIRALLVVSFNPFLPSFLTVTVIRWLQETWEYSVYMKTSPLKFTMP